MKKYIIAILTCIVLWACDRNETITKYDADPRTNFDALWEILDERYCYFTYKGIDWTEVYNQFLPRVNKVKDVFQLFDLMAEMIDILEDGHVNLYAPFDVSSCTGWFDSYPADYNADFLYNHFDSDLRSAGGFAYTTIDNGKVGYIRYSSFSNGFTTANLAYIDAYFHQLNKVEGIIIDVRNNGGGSLGYSELLASCFFKEKTTTGYMRHKTDVCHDCFSDPTPIITDPKDAPIDWSEKKVAVLSNRRCYSATNDFIVRMKQAPNAIVVGGITGGGGGMPLSQELPNGWMVRFSAVPMFDAEMQHTEFGVMPDIEVHISPDDTDDTILLKAIKELGIFAISEG
jgi:hypothetical protein